LENVTKSVTVVWRPARFAVRWAQVPDEVPAFDPSRGGDPFYEGATYRFESDGTPMTLTFRTANLGGGADPPLPKWESWAIFDLSGNEVPISGDNYPRLVRASDRERKGAIVVASPLEELAALGLVEDDDEFMSRAQEVASAIGPLSFDEIDSSAVGWRYVTRELAAHMSLVKDINEAAELERLAVGASATGWLEDSDKARHQELLDPVAHELSLPTKALVLAAIRSGQTLGELRHALAELYWNAFGDHLRPYSHRGSHYDKGRLNPALQKLLVDVGSPGQLVIRCGSRGWALYELWRLVTQVEEIRTCEGCHRLFQPRRKDQRHCSAGCRTKALRIRTKGKSSRAGRH